MVVIVHYIGFSICFEKDIKEGLFVIYGRSPMYLYGRNLLDLFVLYQVLQVLPPLLQPTIPPLPLCGGRPDGRFAIACTCGCIGLSDSKLF